MALTNHSPDPASPGRKRFGPVAWCAIVLALLVIGTIVVLNRPGWHPPEPGPLSLPDAPARYEPRAGPHQVRPPTVAGQFYPGTAEELYGAIGQLMTNSPPVGRKGARALVVPHAGYVFSAEVAAASFREVEPNFKRVFLLAANHNGEADFSGVSLPEVSHYAIPGAEIPLGALVDDLKKDPLFINEPRAHTMHMIEVELPFLHYLRGQPNPVDFTIVPMIIGRLDRVQIDRLGAILARHADDHTLFVFSADLSHYHPDAQARQLDMFSVNSIMSRDPDSLARATTDANQMLMALLKLAELKDWEPDFLAYRNSGDASGDRDRVVGYASVIFGAELSLAEAERRDFLDYARRVVEEHVRNGKTLEADPDLLARHPTLRIPRAVFVTLKKKGQLRGCIGDIVSNAPLHEGIRKCAISAASKDPRFTPVTPDELSQLVLSISILNFPRKVQVPRPEDYVKVLRPGKDGVILSFQGRQSTFLPSVWAEIPEPREFLAHLCQKQGSPPESWLDPAMAVFRYGTYEFGENP